MSTSKSDIHELHIFIGGCSDPLVIKREYDLSDRDRVFDGFMESYTKGHKGVKALYRIDGEIIYINLERVDFIVSIKQGDNR